MESDFDYIPDDESEGSAFIVILIIILILAIIAVYIFKFRKKKSIKNIKQIKSFKKYNNCKCKVPWPCLDKDTKKCYGSGKYSDYPDYKSTKKFCTDAFSPCMNNFNKKVFIKNKNEKNCKKIGYKNCNQSIKCTKCSKKNKCKKCDCNCYNKCKDVCLPVMKKSCGIEYIRKCENKIKKRRSVKKQIKKSTKKAILKDVIKCECLGDGKKFNSCNYWNGTDKKPWCYSEKCGNFSKKSKKYWKYCNISEVNLPKKTKKLIKIKKKVKKKVKNLQNKLDSLDTPKLDNTCPKDDGKISPGCTKEFPYRTKMPHHKGKYCYNKKSCAESFSCWKKSGGSMKCKEIESDSCKCLADGKKYNYCNYWDGKNKKPWCYSKKCGTFSQTSRKYWKNCTKNEVELEKKDCKCTVPWPCYDTKSKKCFGSGNRKDYPNEKSIHKYCNPSFKGCINGKYT